MQASGINVLFLGRNFARLIEGLWVTMRISLLAVLLSIPLGILLGMFMTLRHPLAKAVSRVYLEFVRIMPQLVLLFIAYFGVSRTRITSAAVGSLRLSVNAASRMFSR